jgi:hypothetical protein
MSKLNIVITAIIGLIVMAGVGVGVYVSTVDPEVLAGWFQEMIADDGGESFENNISMFLPGIIIFFVAIIFLAGFYPLIKGALGKSKKKKVLKERGQKATAKVMTVRDTGITINNNPHIKITVEVRPGVTAELSHTVSRVSIPRPGDQIEIVYDPSNPENVLLASDLQ